MKNLFERTSSNWVRYSENPIKLYRHYPKAFVASRPSAVFCSPQCKNKHNVYKSRARKNSSDREAQDND